MTAWALVPIGKLSTRKSRLSAILSPQERQSLQVAMLKDVLSSLSHVQLLAGAAMISADPEIQEIARHCGVRIIAETNSDGLNAAVAAGSDVLRGMGAALIVVLPGDIPLLDPTEIDISIKTALAEQKTIVVPDRRRDGTNVLAFFSASPPAFSYGPGSYGRHLAGAKPSQSLALASCALDIDTPDDLKILVRSETLGRAKYTREALFSMRRVIGPMELCR